MDFLISFLKYQLTLIYSLHLSAGHTGQSKVMANKNGLGQVIKNMTKATIYRVMAFKYGKYFLPTGKYETKIIHDYVYVFNELTKKSYQS